MSPLSELQFLQPAEGMLTVAFTGSWKLEEELPSVDEVRKKVEGTPEISKIAFDTQKLTHWDTGFLTFLVSLSKYCSQQKMTIDDSGLPQGAKKLLALAAAVPEKKDARKAAGRIPFLALVGDETVGFFRSAGELLAFIGDAVIAFMNLLRGRAQYRRSDLWLIMEACSGQALPIVSLICFLVGLILAFIGAIQLTAVRCPNLRGRSGGYRHGAADGSDHDRYRHGR